MMRGFLLIDKDKGLTSFDVVKKIRNLISEEEGVQKKKIKVGHSGTLDPLATGLLIIAVGEATKLLEFFIGYEKEYEVTAKLGWVSDSFDADGNIEKFGEIKKDIKKNDIQKILKDNFLGEIKQVPPKYSAIKIKGKKAYELARKGEEFEIKERKVTIKKIEIIGFELPRLRLKIACSSGTYIRSLVHDLGQKMGCGAYVEELRRTKINDFDVKKSKKISDVETEKKIELIKIEKMIKDFSTMVLDDKDFEGLKDGKVLIDQKISSNYAVAIYEGKVVGILENFKDAGIKYSKILK
jgi:tRNA pseudouridine55 synthase